MGVLSSLRQQDEDKGVLRYCSGEISVVLSQVQKGNPGDSGTTEDGTERRARRLKRRACFLLT